jgi:hypothetical protein
MMNTEMKMSLDNTLEQWFSTLWDHSLVNSFFIRWGPGIFYCRARYWAAARQLRNAVLEDLQISQKSCLKLSGMRQYSMRSPLLLSKNLFQAITWWESIIANICTIYMIDCKEIQFECMYWTELAQGRFKLLHSIDSHKYLGCLEGRGISWPAK